MKKMKNEPLDISEYLYCIGQVIADLLCNNAMSLGTFLLVKQYLYIDRFFSIYEGKSLKKNMTEIYCLTDHHNIE